MIVSSKGSIFRLLMWQWRSVLLYAIFATTAVVLHHEMGYTWLKLPALPLGIVGGALGIFVSFRTNSAYDRWWEGRKLWGRMINTSRHFCTQIITFIGSTTSTDNKKIIKGMVYRHIAYVHTLRCLLRKQDPHKDEFVLQFLTDEEKETMQGQTNMTHALLHSQSEDMVKLSDQGEIDAFRLQSMDESILHLLDIQGGCERIKKTPMPRGYGFIAERLIRYYSALLPLALVVDLYYWTIPLSILVCLSFGLISETGRVLEDPFTMYWNTLPLSAISRTIEVNLRQRLGETDLPPLLQPDKKGILY